MWTADQKKKKNQNRNREFHSGEANAVIQARNNSDYVTISCMGHLIKLPSPVIQTLSVSVKIFIDILRM